MSSFIIRGLVTVTPVLMCLASAVMAQVAPLPLPPAPSQTDTRGTEQDAAPLPPLPGRISPSSTPPMSQSPSPTKQMPASIEVLPQIASPSTQPEQSLTPEGIYMPGIVSALIADKLETLPDLKDIRQYIFSIYKGMVSVCNARSDSAGMDAVGYVEPGLGPGRDAAKVGMEKGMMLLLAIAQAHKTGDINALGRTMSAEAVQSSEGLSDGTTLATHLGCLSQNYNAAVVSIEKLMRVKAGKDYQPNDQLAFVALMSPSYRRQLGIEDPAVTLKKRRLKAATDQAKNGCQRKYDNPRFCECIFSRLKEDTLEEADWNSIAFSFGAIIKVASYKPSIAQSIRSCIR